MKIRLWGSRVLPCG